MHLHNMRDGLTIASLEAPVSYRLKTEARDKPRCRLLCVADPEFKVMKPLVFTHRRRALGDLRLLHVWIVQMHRRLKKTSL